MITVSSQFKFLLLLRDTVSFPTDERFSPEDRWFSHNSDYQDMTKTSQYLLQFGCVVFALQSRRVSTSSNSGVWGSFLLFLTFPGFCTFVCGTLTGILYLHVRNTLLHLFTLFVFLSSFLRSFLTDLAITWSTCFDDLHVSTRSHDVMSCA
jgi:hypothetical protein